MVGTYYLPQLFKERNAAVNFSDKLKENRRPRHRSRRPGPTVTYRPSWIDRHPGAPFARQCQNPRSNASRKKHATLIVCTQCGATMKLVSFIERRLRDVIERILRPCGLWRARCARWPALEDRPLERPSPRAAVRAGVGPRSRVCGDRVGPARCASVARAPVGARPGVSLRRRNKTASVSEIPTHVDGCVTLS